MPGTRSWVALVLVALTLVAVGSRPAAGSHAAVSGTIVFASDRGKLDPGEIYSVGLGLAKRDVSRSLAPDYGLAVAPLGDRIAFWSDRGGLERVFLARGDGSHLHAVRGVGGSFATQQSLGGPLSFSADGRSLVASYTRVPGPAFHGIRTTIYRIDVRRAVASVVHVCDGVIAASPSGRLVACGHRLRTIIFGADGRVRFQVAGSAPSWSSRNELAVSNAMHLTPFQVGATRIYNASGALIGRTAGIPIAWSRDGRELALRRAPAIYVADPHDLAHARKLSQESAGGYTAFTPDGRYLSTVDSGGQPVLVPVDGGVAIDGLDAGSGVWSASGRVAYVHVSYPLAPGATVPLMITDTHGRHPQVAARFSYDEHGYSALQWLPDGRHVIVQHSFCGGKGLYAVSANGGPAHALNHDPRNDESPALSPSGTRIAYSVENSGCIGHGESIHIETVAANGSDARRVTSDGDATQGSYDGRPVFSPDGTRVAYMHGTISGGSLQTIAVNGGTPTVLEGGAPAAWSPDGTQLAYLAGRSIMAVPAAGGPPHVLAPDPAADPDSGACGYPGIAWSPDGSEIAIPSGRGIYLVTLGTQPTSRLAIPVPCTGDPAFSPDGTQIAFDAIPPHALGEQTAVMAARIDGSHLRTVTTVPFRISIHPAWEP